MRRILTFGSDAFSFHLKGLRGFFQRTIGANRQNAQATAAIIADNQPFARFVHLQMHRVHALRRLGIERIQLARRFVNRKSTYQIPLRDAVQKAFVGRQSQKSGILIAFCNARRRDIARFRIEAIDVNAFARLAGERSDV